MVKNCFRGICYPRKSDGRNDDDNGGGYELEDSNAIVVIEDVDISVAHYDGNNDDSKGTGTNIHNAGDSGVGAKKRSKKRIRSGANEQKDAHDQADTDDDIRKKEKEKGKPPAIPLWQDPKYGKYFKLLEDGVPLSTIKMTIEQDGLDPTIIDLDSNSTLKSRNREQRKQQQKGSKPRSIKKVLNKSSQHSSTSKRRGKKEDGRDTNIDDEKEDNEFASGGYGTVDVEAEDGVRDTNTAKKKSKNSQARKSSRKKHDNSRESDHQKDFERNEEGLRGKDPLPSEKKDKKKKDKKKKKKSSRKKDEKDEEVNEGNAVDEKDRIIENLTDKLEEKGEMIESLHESLWFMTDQIQDTEQKLSIFSLGTDDSISTSEKSFGEEDDGCQNKKMRGDKKRLESDVHNLKQKDPEELTVEKSSLVSNGSCSSESMKLTTSENHLDDNVMEDSNKSIDIGYIQTSNENLLSNFNDDIESGNDNDHSNDNEDESLNPDEIISANKSLTDLNCDNDSLDDVELFELDSPIPRPKKQFLEAALTAKSLSDLNYVHPTQATKASRRKSTTDLEEDDGSLGDDEVFELDSAILRPKKQFLEAALTAKSMSDINYVHTAQIPEGCQDYDASNDSLDDVGLFELDQPIPRPKKQFLEAALMAKSLSDINYVYSTEAPTASRRKSTTDLEEDGSLGNDEVFELDPPILRPKKQFLEAALIAKSISDINYVHTAHTPEGSIKDYNASMDSLDDVEVFGLDSPIPRPKKQFLEAALIAKSLSDINYVYSTEAPTSSRRNSMTDYEEDDGSLGNDEVFELASAILRPKKQFLEAALTAKSISDINYVHTAHTPEGSISQDNYASIDSLDDVELFKLDQPIPRPKKQFLEAALMAKSLSDINYVYSTQAPTASRRKSLTDLECGDDGSLGDDEVFELDPQVPRPKKQFLEAALMAKSLSDLNYMHVNSTTISFLNDNESRDDTSNIVPEHLLRLSQPNVFHTPDIHSIKNGDLFESLPEDPPIDRPILKAALEAKAQQDEGISVISTRDAPNNPSNDDQTKIVPEHLVIANQPATVHAHDNYSIEVEDIFDHPSGEQNPQKPLLKAALEAHAQREEGFGKSLSHLKTVNQAAESPSACQKISKSVPDHLTIINQPTKALPTLDELSIDNLAILKRPTKALQTLDELSIDNDRLFDTPEPEGKNPLLMAALRAKEETKILQSPFSKNELSMLKEIEHARNDQSSKTIDTAEHNDGGVESKK